MPPDATAMVQAPALVEVMEPQARQVALGSLGRRDHHGGQGLALPGGEGRGLLQEAVAQAIVGVVRRGEGAAAVDRTVLQQAAKPVGELDLAGAVADRRFEGGEDVGREDVAADDREVGRRHLR